MAGVLEALGGLEDRLAHVQADFADPLKPAWVIEQAVERFGHVDVLVANHARSSKQSLEQVTAAELDLAWACERSRQRAADPGVRRSARRSSLW
jgi:3-oxoacyl-[acyl-carrier protein] reductase